jgi:hypothetical protein
MQIRRLLATGRHFTYQGRERPGIPGIKVSPTIAIENYP